MKLNIQFGPIPILMLLMAALFSGCTAMKLLESAKIKKPEVKYVNYRIGNPDLQKVPVYLNFNAHNPNEIGLKNVFVSYELYTEGNRFLKGDDIELSLAPNGDTRIEVSAEIIYKDVLIALGPVARKVWFGQKTLPVMAKVNIFGKPTVYNGAEEGGLFSFAYNTTQTVDIPIPQDQIEDAKNKAKDKLKELFH